MPRFGALVLAVVLTLPGLPLLAQNDADVVGSWAFTTQSPEGERTNTMVISRDGDRLKAVVKGERGERPYDAIELTGSTITLQLTISYNGAPMLIVYRGKVSGNTMSGDADFGGLASGSWQAERK